MKKIFTILAILLTLIAAFYGVWRYRLSDDVARVKATIDYQNQQFRAYNRWITLKADKVRAYGFPLESKIRVIRPTLTFVWGEETYGASLPYADLTLRDAASGAYAVELPPYVEGVYAKSGQSPEEYRVTPKDPLHVLLRAQPDSRRCSNFPGSTPCAAVGAADPLISYAVEIPARLTIAIDLDKNHKEASFTLTPLNIPIFQTIPTDMDRPVELFINILREAMVFQSDRRFQ